MALPTVTSIYAFYQGTGQSFLPHESSVALQVFFTSTNNDACNFNVQVSPDNGVTWYPATLHSFGNGQNLVPNIYSPSLIVIDVRLTIQNNGLAQHTYSQFKVRFNIVDNTTAETMATWYTYANSITVKASRPVVSSIQMAQWTGQAVASFAPYTTDINDYDGTETVFDVNNGDYNHHYRASLNPSDLDPGSSLAFSYNYTTTPTFSFGTSVESSYTIYYRAYDQFYNASDLVSVGTFLQRTAPQNCLLRITGTNDNSDYTGITINSDGTFTPNRTVQLDLGSTSSTVIPLYFTILTTSQVELTGNVGITLPLTTMNLVQMVNLTTNRSSPSSDNFNQDATITISVKFSDAANNYTLVNQTIRLNTRIYQSLHSPLRPIAADYNYKVSYLNSSGIEVVVPKSIIFNSNPFRKWKDIYYPATHGYPLDTNGNFSLTAVLADTNLKTGLPTASYDPVVLINTNNVYTASHDTEGRPITYPWTTDGTKNYLNMESQDQANPRCWIIDNIGYGDFQIEFGWFDLDSVVYGPPYNTQSPYEGDVLVMYDASANGATQLVTDVYGQESWRLVDSTKLVELAAFTGSGTNVVDLKTGKQMNSTAKGEFVTDAIQNISKVAFILYTDDAGTASGFWIKSGESHDQLFSNYDVDESHGQIWMHMHESISNTMIRGAADTTVKRFYYDYLPQTVSVSLTTGEVTFNVPPSGNYGSPYVEADFAYWNAFDYSTGKFIAAHDDQVDFYDAPIYVVPSGNITITAAQELDLYETTGHGRIVQGYTWDHDRGLLEIDSLTPFPSGHRLVSDYFYHSYKRLSNDGFGTMMFRDQILVADVTPNYPDYTWVDVKIINESNTDITDLQIQMVPRGYDTDGDGNATFTGTNVVDQVLDINRPWDIQEGTKDETFNKCAMGILPTYDWIRLCPKTGGNGLTGASGATTILGTWLTRVYGTISARAQAYGRTVWVLGGSGGTGYPTSLSAGRKSWSLEMQGKYYASLVL